MPTQIDTLILDLRGGTVILDTDLASIYGATTKHLNEQVKRDAERFLEDFFFQPTQDEWNTVDALRSQNATLENEKNYGPRFKWLLYTMKSIRISFITQSAL